MTERIWWYLSRSAGIVTAVLLVGGLVLGVLMATRAMKGFDRPAWLLAMHRWLSALIVTGTAIHVLALVADNFVTFGWLEILVPMGSSWRPVAVGLGVVSMYLLVAVHVSSLLMKRLAKPWWRRIHVLSYLLVWTALMHAGLAGSDVTSPVFQFVALLLTMAAVCAAVLRVMLGRSVNRREGPSPASAGRREGALAASAARRQAAGARPPTVAEEPADSVTPAPAGVTGSSCR